MGEGEGAEGSCIRRQAAGTGGVGSRTQKGQAAGRARAGRTGAAAAAPLPRCVPLVSRSHLCFPIFYHFPFFSFVPCFYLFNFSFVSFFMCSMFFLHFFILAAALLHHGMGNMVCANPYRFTFSATLTCERLLDPQNPKPKNHKT